ncbi:MAG: radical SAM protein [Candidatus Tagabacteria bacterium RIFCSPLOWO2_01_FULL_39_11]|uniref:Radical SAM protein n=1 Tax=Candidatus Tagabacteria bacterium RIFCSPLOWO2_01_FULL_39_11 TaxID=1802295 RepID=A0A1G2LTY3_9BACT|nr:MAG: radical SAM protein [Candidatus Tagabacteria bacterium RIFCSPLOWO2_01_FULL_39_11]
MMDDYGIDSHKLTYHPEWTARWKKAKSSVHWDDCKEIYPIYIEVTPSGACNHRCVFCAFDYVGYKPNFLDFKIFKKRIGELARLGVKAILYGGEGEPLLNKNIGEIIAYTAEVGIDPALTPNGVLLNEKLLKKILKYLVWMKVSVDAGTAKTYAFIHRTKEEDFGKVLRNLALTVLIKRENNYECTIGTQMILLPENAEEAIMLALRVKEIGVDYIVIKPYSQHRMSIERKYENLRYNEYYQLAEKLEKLNSDSFKIIFRARTMEKLSEERLRFCGAVPFLWAHIMSTGDVYSCSAFLKDKRFFLGNIYNQTFQEIWEGDLRKEHWLSMKDFDVFSKCRDNCRMNECNLYLWDLLNPSKHVNFI